MKQLYITENFESVQPHLIENLRDSGTDAAVFHHTLAYKKSIGSYPQYVTVENAKGRAYGPVFYLSRLRHNAKKCMQLLRSFHPDVTHGNMLFCDGYICRRIFRKSGIPYIVNVRNTDINSRFLWNVPWIRKIGIKVLLDAKQVVFLSYTGKEELLKKLPQNYRSAVENKCCIIPNGIDAFYLEHIYHVHEIQDDMVHMISVGKINKNKNLETTIQAMDILTDRGMKCELTVVGAIEDAFYSDLIHNDKRIRYFPKCPKEEVLEHLRTADIFVMPSHTETFGLVYAEAMSQGVPVVYTKGQGFDGQYKDGEVGYAVPDDAPEYIADCIEKIVSDYGNISQNCISTCNRYDWKLIAESYKLIYNSVL